VDLDEVDHAIVRVLRTQARVSQERLAQEVRLSRPAVHARLRRLEEGGILRGYHADVDWAALGKPLTVIVWVRTTGTDCRTTARQVVACGSEDAEVEACHRVTGEWCMVLTAHVADPTALESLIDRIRRVPGVTATTTTLALSTTAP
jgi:Lrp/AsnC family transcriptional regulator, leucine-responsive regulatory protein